MPLLTIQNMPVPPVEVPPGTTLLAALQAAGHDWMHACGGRGRCTSCRLHVTAGAAHLSALSVAEEQYRAAGRLLPTERLTCQARLETGPAAGRVPRATQLPHVQYQEPT